MRRNVYEELAENTRRVLQARKWSLRKAQIATDVHHSVVQYMSHGQRPRPEVLLRWAEAIREDPAAWLRWAGYDYVGNMIAGASSEDAQDAIAEPEDSAAATAHRDAPSEPAPFVPSEHLAFYNDDELSDEEKREIASALETIVLGVKARKHRNESAP
ncbi:MAG TPA: hypothetical protein VLH79_11025 [Chthonomonadales bacterium]|nr:hypothetical protein [Chthonomonadales bacterium]